MDLIDIKIFLLLAKSNNLSQTSSIVNFSQSTVSYRIRKLETFVGARLIYREKGKSSTQLTERGEAFIEIAERWADLYQDTQRIKNPNHQRLTAGVVHSISTSIFTDAYQDLVKQHPNLRFEVYTRYSDDIYSLIENRYADLGYVSIPQDRRNLLTTPSLKQTYKIVIYRSENQETETYTPEQLDVNNELYISWGEDFDSWHRNLWTSPDQYHIKIDDLSLLESLLNSEGLWAIVPSASAYKLAHRNSKVKVARLVCESPFIKTYHKVIRRSMLSSNSSFIEVFDTLVSKYSSQHDLSGPS